MSNDSDNKNLPQVTPDKNIALASKQLATVNKALTTINREKFIKFLERNKDAAKFFIGHISWCSNVLDIDFIEQQGKISAKQKCLQVYNYYFSRLALHQFLYA